MDVNRKATQDEDYLEARRILENGTAQERQSLAASQDTHPEVLYYLAEDEDSVVRSTVAANPKTPSQADILLCEDKDGDVRTELARKISRLVPGLSRTDRKSVV